MTANTSFKADALIDVAKAAGVLILGSGIDEDAPPVLVSADGSVAEGGYAWASPLRGAAQLRHFASRSNR